VSAMPENVPDNSQDPVDGQQPRELQRQERRELEHQASRFLKRLQLPVRVLDEFQRLKNFLLYEREKGKAGSVLAITSAWPGEGVSFVAFHTAVSLAKGLENSVLLVDANFKRPVLHKLFNNPNTVGLSDILSAGIEFHRAIRPTYMPYLAFLPSGGPLLDPAQFFRSERFNEILNEFRSRFDYVIFDTPAISKFADCLVMGPKVDQVILVVRAHRTKRQVVEHAKEEIAKHGGKLLGVVLNRRRFFIPEFIYRRL
jgi:capsular exopolysaccharide synthesis family protein